MSTDRSQLTSRVPPSMELSDGSASSMTAPPKPPSLETPPSQRAIDRFAVRGNAIVTGGAGGIGSAACRALLEHGLSGLAIFDLHPTEAQAAVDQLRAQFPAATIIFIQANVTDAESIANAVAAAEKELGPVNVLLCLAGIVSTLHALDVTLAEWNKVLSVNTTGAFICAQAVAKSMVKNGKGGSIILTASISAHLTNFPQPQVQYNASKAAILSIKKSLAAEWARYGIRVNSISPGYMDTILNEGDGLEPLRRKWMERIPYGRMGQPEELTGAIVLLASNAGSYITGSDILVDGGTTAF